MYLSLHDAGVRVGVIDPPGIEPESIFLQKRTLAHMGQKTLARMGLERFASSLERLNSRYSSSGDAQIEKRASTIKRKIS